MTPIDKERCQAEKTNSQSFMSLGGNCKMIRCENKPNFIATETKADAEGLKGSMSMCVDCLKVAKKQLPKGFFNLIKV